MFHTICELQDTNLNFLRGIIFQIVAFGFPF